VEDDKKSQLRYAEVTEKGMVLGMAIEMDLTHRMNKYKPNMGGKASNAKGRSVSSARA